MPPSSNVCATGLLCSYLSILISIDLPSSSFWALYVMIFFFFLLVSSRGRPYGRSGLQLMFLTVLLCLSLCFIHYTCLFKFIAPAALECLIQHVICSI